MDVASTAYLEQPLVFETDRICTQDGTQIMMAWEKPIMERMARLVSARRGRVLEIGFGMGISAKAVQSHHPTSHVIIEAHPQIVQRAQAWATSIQTSTPSSKRSPHIIEGRWQDRLPEVLERFGPFDGVSFDVFGGDAQREHFFSQLDTMLSSHGCATLWLEDLGIISDSLRSILKQQGMQIRYTQVYAIPTPDCRYSRTNEFCVPYIERCS